MLLRHEIMLREGFKRLAQHLIEFLTFLIEACILVKLRSTILLIYHIPLLWQHSTNYNVTVISLLGQEGLLIKFASTSC